MDKLPGLGDNSTLMTRSIPKKSQTMKEICAILGMQEILPTVGSSVPRVFFSDIAAEMGLQPEGSMPATAKKIIEHSKLTWSDEFTSEKTPSGGGGTVTALGLLQLKNAVLVWSGRDIEHLPTSIIVEDWIPPNNWKDMRQALPKETHDIKQRPGAQEFRNLVLTEYDNQCALTGTRAIEAIDIAHIIPYFGIESDVVQNAVPMRADLHRLFDKGLINIEVDQNNYSIDINELITRDYSFLNNKKLILPNDQLCWPSPHAISIHKQLLV